MIATTIPLLSESLQGTPRGCCSPYIDLTTKAVLVVDNHVPRQACWTMISPPEHTDIHAGPSVTACLPTSPCSNSHTHRSHQYDMLLCLSFDVQSRQEGTRAAGTARHGTAPSWCMMLATGSMVLESKGIKSPTNNILKLCCFQCLQNTTYCPQPLAWAREGTRARALHTNDKQAGYLRCTSTAVHIY